MEVNVPYALTAELTHRCPLHCIYCSNPIELQKREDELSTNDWLKILEEASSLGIVQVHFSGGEPLLRTDLEQLVQRARILGFFINLITSGIGLTDRRLGQLIEAGVDSIQLSVQATTSELALEIAGRDTLQRKRAVAKMIRDRELPLNMNVVLHRQNLHQVEELIELCVSWGAERLELANTQYYGWALKNRDYLFPSKEQLMAAEEAFMRARERFGKQIELIWVLPDYYEEYPKPCMGGWGELSLTITPNGKVLPCTAAASITTIQYESIKEHDLKWIWNESTAFNVFRGFDWMMEPCKTCERRFEDFGGCRCQAFMLTGDAKQTDPVCKWSPNHSIITNTISRTRNNLSSQIASYRGK